MLVTPVNHPPTCHHTDTLEKVSVSVENALYYDERLAEVAAVGVPDEKLGELVAAVVSTKPAFHGQVNESELLELARSRSAQSCSSE